MKIKVNDVVINYEVHGEGAPIILVHGNSENHKIFNKLVEKLENNYKVYAIDSRCHGESEDTKEISYDLMSRDTIEFIKKLKIEKPIFYGFSDGGIIGLLIAIREPNLLSKLIVSGANLNPSGMKKSMLIFSKAMYYITRNKLFRMMIKEPDIRECELEKIIIPTVVLAGENDAIREEHTKYIANSIRGSILEIIPNENHGSYIINSDKIYEIIKKYI